MRLHTETTNKRTSQPSSCNMAAELEEFLPSSTQNAKPHWWRKWSQGNHEEGANWKPNTDRPWQLTRRPATSIQIAIQHLKKPRENAEPIINPPWNAMCEQHCIQRPRSLKMAIIEEKRWNCNHKAPDHHIHTVSNIQLCFFRLFWQEVYEGRATSLKIHGTARKNTPGNEIPWLWIRSRLRSRAKIPWEELSPRSHGPISCLSCQ